MCCTATKQKTPQVKFSAAPAALNANEVQRFKFDTPSPDDAVIEAQKTATGSANATSQQSQQVATGLRTPSPQSQGLAAVQTVTEGESIDIVVSIIPPLELDMLPIATAAATTNH